MPEKCESRVDEEALPASGRPVRVPAADAAATPGVGGGGEEAVARLSHTQPRTQTKRTHTGHTYTRNSNRISNRISKSKKKMHRKILQMTKKVNKNLIKIRTNKMIKILRKCSQGDGEDL